LKILASLSWSITFLNCSLKAYSHHPPRHPPRPRQFFLSVLLVAELQRASEAPWVTKIGNPSSRENLVMTSAYERANVRTSVRPYRLGGRGRGRGISRYSSRSPIRETKECYFLGGFLFRKVRKTLLSICHVNKRSERLI